MKRKNIISALLVAGLLIGTPMVVDAAGLGKLKVLSALGQPLRAEIDLIAIPKDEVDLLTARIATIESYKQAKIERQEGVGSVRFAVVKNPNGEAFLKLSSVQAFNEPFLQLLIQLDWPTGRLLREYTILLDPPGFQEAGIAPAISAPVTKSEAAKPAAVVVTPLARSEESAPVKPSKKALQPAPVKKEAKEAPLLKAESSRKLTPAELTFPRFEGSEQTESAQSEKQAVLVTSTPRPSTPASSERREHTVQKGDTLSKIARNNPVEGYSLEQMMVAIYESNGEAFSANNMNRITTGKSLSVPDKAALDARGTSQGAAAKEIKAHAADWNAYRQKLAGAVAEQQPAKDEAKSESSGKITAKAEDKDAKPQEPGKDVLKLSKGEAAGKGDAGKGNGAEAKALKERLAAAQDEAVAKEKALKEANSRISELDKNIKDMQSLLELKNKQLAELEKQAKLKPTPAPTPIPAPVADAPKPEPAKLPEAAPAPVPVPEPEVVAQAPAQPAPQLAKPPVKKPVPQPELETSFLDTVMSNPLYLGGSAAAVVGALFAGLWALGRRRKKSLASFEDSIMTGSDLKTNTVFGNTAGGQIDTGDTSFLTDFSQAGMGAIDTNDVDPIAEAEVYMAYGRDAQAEEILKEAMSKDPERHEVQLKLLEIYAGRKNTGAFETLAAELYAATSGQGSVWNKAAEFGRGLDPANPLYASQGEDSDMPMPAASVAVGGVAAATAAAQDLDFNLDLDTQAGTPQAELPELSDEDLGGALDFDLDTIGGLTLPEDETSASAAKDAADEIAALDFNLDSIIPQAVEKKADAPEVMADLGLDNLQFDAPSFPVDKSASGQPAARAEPSLDEDTLALDFDFNLDQSDSTTANATSPLDADTLMPELDLSGINLDLGQTETAATEDFGGSELEDATTLVGDSSVWEESSTKLDLARAYLEMGDKEGAREILQEVVGEGGPEQQAEANKLLATLG